MLASDFEQLTIETQSMNEKSEARAATALSLKVKRANAVQVGQREINILDPLQGYLPQPRWLILAVVFTKGLNMHIICRMYAASFGWGAPLTAGFMPVPTAWEGWLYSGQLY